jgi:hypothetical protein
MKQYPRANFAGSFYPKQQEVEDDDHRFKVVAFGRQAGKSYYAKRSALDKAINKHARVMIVFPAIPTARQHWNEMTGLLRRAKFPCKIREASKEIHFPGGGFIMVRSAQEPDNLRGATLDYLILDEAAFYPAGEYLWWGILLPMVTASRGDVLIISTPNGKNWFYRLWLLGQPNTELGLLTRDPYYKSWQMPAWESPYQDLDLLAQIKATMPEIRYREEYGAEFLGSVGGVFVGTEEVALSAFLSTPLPGSVYAAGVDWGSTHDFTVFAVFDYYTRKLVFIERFTGTGVIETIHRIVKLIRLWNPKVTHIEKNGLGETNLRLLKDTLAGRDMTLVDALMDDYNEHGVSDERSIPEDEPEREYGGFRIKPVHMDNETKRAIIERLAADIQYKHLELLKPEHDADIAAVLLSELSTMVMTRTDSGQQVTYKAQEGEHDDLPMAVALAYKGVPGVTRVVPMKKIEQEAVRRSPFRKRR